MYGCEHYLRRCTIFAECCSTAYPCIHCHNNDCEDHQMTSKDVAYIICNSCGCKQTPKQRCEMCNTLFGIYFCDKCIIFDDTQKGIVHCDECGICRVSLGNKMYHCSSCNMCNFVKHDRCYKIDDCPICGDDLHKSIKITSKTKCNHWIHEECLNELFRRDYRCPVCMKSLITVEQLASIVEPQIADYQMPPDLADTDQEIYCNDCEKITTTKFHILAMKCADCGSYNTRKN